MHSDIANTPNPRRLYFVLDPLATHPEESEGGREGQRSETGVVPSEETWSSWVKGWCSKNLETSSKLETQRRDGGKD